MRTLEKYRKLRAIINNLKKKVQKIPEQDIFLCSMYYSVYLKKHDKKTWDNFIKLFNKLDFCERLQVMENVNPYLKEKEKIKLKGKEMINYE